MKIGIQKDALDHVEMNGCVVLVLIIKSEKCVKRTFAFIKCVK